MLPGTKYNSIFVLFDIIEITIFRYLLFPACLRFRPVPCLLYISRSNCCLSVGFHWVVSLTYFPTYRSTLDLATIGQACSGTARSAPYHRYFCSCASYSFSVILVDFMLIRYPHHQKEYLYANWGRLLVNLILRLTGLFVFTITKKIDFNHLWNYYLINIYR